MDKYFRVEVLSATLHPQSVIYAALHQDYAEEFVFDNLNWVSDYESASYYPRQEDLTESEAGQRVIKNLLAGNRGHFGPLEHPQIIFNCGWFPHSTLQQVRTHRVGISFDCQSFRYTGKRIVDVALENRPVEEVFYLRPVGHYTDRQGKKYEYTEELRNKDLEICFEATKTYADRIKLGYSEEHARGLIPFDVRQHWVVSCNVRSLMHLLDMRWPKNAQLECQQLCELIWPHFQNWVPQVADWYEKNRINKVRLAP